ncbi:MAG: CatB-related O-acetyltransferase [Lachnospiraceae bacterium]|nr:CatB-related O-acetyltransferase [Lachnospiraceae bacterium]
MEFIKRKIGESASIVFRFFIWPWIRAYKEIATKSIMKQRSYIPGTKLEGRNFIGRETILRDCSLGYGSYVQNRGDLKDTDIGRYTSIGKNVETVIGSHPTKKLVALHPAFNNPHNTIGFSYTKRQTFKDLPSKRTSIGSDVWLGNDVRIMGGVTIGDGAVVGAGALVIRDLPPYSINVGVPAKTIRYRFDKEQIEKLLKDKWWEKGEEQIKNEIERFSDIEEFLK